MVSRCPVLVVLRSGIEGKGRRLEVSEGSNRSLLSSS